VIRWSKRAEEWSVDVEVWSQRHVCIASLQQSVVVVKGAAAHGLQGRSKEKQGSYGCNGDCCLLHARVGDRGESLESSWLLARAAGSGRCAS
jgi:hypothetical protein